MEAFKPPTPRNFLESPDELWPRCLLQLSAIVDGIYAEHGHTAGSFTHLASDRLLVGGGADARSLQGAKGIHNFVGCLRKVEFIAEGVKMELIEAARSGAAGTAAWGKIDFHCREPRASDPITFTTRDSHLVSIPALLFHYKK
ncbi:Nrxn3 [Anthophora quadrimaculata]